VRQATLGQRTRKKQVARLGRADQSALGRWFWEIDRLLLMLLTVLISIGLLAVAAAAPAAAQRYSGNGVTVAALHYFWRQLAWVVLSVPVMLGISMLPKVTARRLALAGAGFFLLMLALVPLIGVEVNGARRWIGVGLGQFQPSEFLKPLFVVALAWLLSLKQQDKTLPVAQISAVLFAAVAVMLMKQPDLGQTVVFAAIWMTLLLLSGVSGRIIGGLVGVGFVGIIAAYLFYPVATNRINNFIYGEGDTYQVDKAHATITGGGFFGTGPGAGEAKFQLPEAHTDYIFSVIGEEFGLIACLAIAVVYLAIVVRVLLKLLDEDDLFTLLAAAGLATQFGVQAIINMAVNLQLAPSKGMTLPLISYGGSSMLALALGMGLLLVFTRRNPYLKRSPYVVTWRGQA
jgi:cell division protein FtsW